MEATETTIPEMAGRAYDWFESFQREPDGPTLYRTKDGAPDWITDLVRAAHGDMLPDDWRYECTMDALSFIHDNDIEDEGDATHEFADQEVDIYTHARYAWLSSNLTRSAYVDDARDEGLIGPDTDLADQIGIGQYQEAGEVFALVFRFLEDRAGL